MQDWQIKTTFQALAEMAASGYGNYIPLCIRPMLQQWIAETGYQPVAQSRVVEHVTVLQTDGTPMLDVEGVPIKVWVAMEEFVPIPKNLK